MSPSIVHDVPRTPAPAGRPRAARAQESTARSCRAGALEVEAVDRLAHDGARLLSALIRTSGVSPRKSPRGGGRRRVTGLRHRDRAVRDLPAVQALAQRLPHGVLDRPEERDGIEPSSTSSRNSTPLPTGAGSTRSPTVARNGFAACRDLDRRAGAEGSLDADRRRLAEVDVDAEVGRQRRLDDLLLHLAVERDGTAPAGVVLPQVDQRVLFGELGERDVQRALVFGRAGTTTSPASAERSGAPPGARPPIASPIGSRPAPRASRSRRAVTESRRTAEPRSKTLIAVTFARPRRPAAGLGRGAGPRTCGRTRSSRRPGRARS